MKFVFNPYLRTFGHHLRRSTRVAKRLWLRSRGDAEQMLVAAEQEAVGGGNRGCHQAFTHRVLGKQFELLADPGGEDHAVLARRVQDAVSPDNS